MLGLKIVYYFPKRFYVKVAKSNSGGLIRLMMVQTYKDYGQNGR